MAELDIRPPSPGWSSAGGVPDVEPRVAHSSGTTHESSGADLSTAEFLRLHQLQSAVLDLERRTAGREPTRDERRLMARYRRLLGEPDPEGMNRWTR